MVKTDTPAETPEKADSPLLLSAFTTVAATNSTGSSTEKTDSSGSSTEKTDTPPLKVLLGNLEFEFEPTPMTLKQIQVATYTKAYRAKLDYKEKAELFERASAKKLQTKFTMMNLKIDDPDKLVDTYNLLSAIDKMKENHIKYDMDDVFNIVIPDPSNPYKVLKMVDLYMEYGSIEVSDVATSNRFYSTMLRNPHGSISENLKTTLEYLLNNMDENLVLKINETYLLYPVEECGGPLFFKLLMDLLQNNLAEAADYLVNVVKNLKISNFDGENVLKVVSLIRGAVKRLTNLKDARGQSALPTDLADHLLDVFQTSSVDDFNSLFKHFRLQSKIASFRLKSGGSSGSTIDKILQFAKNQYHLMKSAGKWTRVDAKSNETFFIAALQAAASSGTKFTICFNCGGAHSFKSCPKPTHKSRIQANQKLFKERKKAGSGSPSSKTNEQNKKNGGKDGKFAPPTETEKKNQSHQVIDGKLYYYHCKSKCWNLVKDATKQTSSGPAMMIAANTATLADNSPGNITPVISNQTRDIAVANASRQLELTFRGLLSQLHET
jgi:hypothetical protein